MKLPKRLQLPENLQKSRKQEATTASRTGGKLTPRSGAGLVKGDVRVRDVVRVEDKITKHASFSVKVEHIQKLESAVLGADEIPMMKVELLDGGVEFIVIPGNYFEEIVEKLKYVNAHTDQQSS